MYPDSFVHKAVHERERIIVERPEGYIRDSAKESELSKIEILCDCNTAEVAELTPAGPSATVHAGAASQSCSGQSSHARLPGQG